MRTWQFTEVGSGALVLAYLAQSVTQRHPESPCDRGRQVGDQALAGLADLFDGQHDPRLGVLVVVADGDGPREVLDVLIAGRELVEAEGVVVDGSSHDDI